MLRQHAAFRRCRVADQRQHRAHAHGEPRRCGQALGVRRRHHHRRFPGAFAAQPQPLRGGYCRGRCVALHCGGKAQRVAVRVFERRRQIDPCRGADVHVDGGDAEHPRRVVAGRVDVAALGFGRRAGFAVDHGQYADFVLSRPQPGDHVARLGRLRLPRRRPRLADAPPLHQVGRRPWDRRPRHQQAGSARLRANVRRGSALPLGFRRRGGELPERVVSAPLQRRVLVGGAEVPWIVGHVVAVEVDVPVLVDAGVARGLLQRGGGVAHGCGGALALPDAAR